MNLSGTSVQEVRVELGQEKLRKYQLSQADIVDIIKANKISLPGDTIQTDGKELTTRIISTIDSIETLKEVTTIGQNSGPVDISRINQQAAVQFIVKYPSTTNLGDMAKRVDKEVAKLDLPEESEVVFSGERELLDSSKDDLILAFGLAIVFVYLVMAAQFESLKYPFVIMFTVPLMVIGVSAGLTITQTPISITVLIGAIVLAGIVVNNAIAIVDYMNQKKESGMDKIEAIVVSVKDRARPILMTSLTTNLELIPLALGIEKALKLISLWRSL